MNAKMADQSGEVMVFFGNNCAEPIMNNMKATEYHQFREVNSNNIEAIKEFLYETYYRVRFKFFIY